MAGVEVTEEQRSHPSFPYNLSSYDDVNVYPLSEFWHQNKPYLLCGQGDFGDGFFIDLYDVIERVEINLYPSKKEYMNGIHYLNRKKLDFNSAWPEEYIKTLTEYQFKIKSVALDHGVQAKLKIHLVFDFNEDWALFRVYPNIFRTIYKPYLSKAINS